MRMALSLCVILPQSNHKLSLSKTSDRSRLRDSLQISDQYALKLKVIKNNESLRNCHISRRQRFCLLDKFLIYFTGRSLLFKYIFCKYFLSVYSLSFNYLNRVFPNSIFKEQRFLFVIKFSSPFLLSVF